MNRRLFAAGVALAALGLAVFGVLAASGALRHPAGAAERATTLELASIGGGFLLVTVGTLATFAGYVDGSLGE